MIPYGTQAIYLRKKFTINNLATIASLILDMDYDDAFVAYINEMKWQELILMAHHQRITQER